MSNAIKNAADKLRGKAVIIPIIIFFIMFIVSCALMYEDYTTSYYGYMSLPTRKVNLWVIPMVALLPQIGQVGFAYVFATDTNKQWALGITVLLWVVDVFTDVFYKAQGLGLLWVGGATIETITIYSIGSEIMMATSLAMLVQLVPDLYSQFLRASKTVVSGKSGNGRGEYPTAFKPVSKPPKHQSGQNRRNELEKFFQNRDDGGVNF